MIVKHMNECGKSSASRMKNEIVIKMKGEEDKAVN